MQMPCGIQTGNTLRHRMTVHRQQIDNKQCRYMKVSHHIAECGRGFKIRPMQFFQLPFDADRIE